MKKRLFALVLCLAMVFTFAPTLAFAEGTVIDTVSITIAEPVAGEYPTYMSSMLEGENYTVLSEGWIDNTNGAELKEKETFKLGNEYYYYVNFMPNDGYTFDYTVTASAGSSNWISNQADVNTEGIVYFDGVYTVTIGEDKVVTDADKIKEKLALDFGTYNSQLGEVPTTIGSAIDCDRYYIYYEYWYNVTDDILVSDTETFEACKLYMYFLSIKPYAEYGFTDDSQITIDGIEWNNSMMWVANDEESEGEFIFMGYYTPGLEPIENVTLNIESVEAGKPLVFIDDVPADAKYTIYSQEWCKESGVEIPQDSTYDTMGVYDYSIVLAPKEGYRFTSNTTCTINGIDWEYSDTFLFDAEMFGDGKYIEFFGRCTAYEKENEATTEATAEVTTEASTTEVATSASIDTPETGNTTNAIVWISLLCVAVAGIFTAGMTLKARK